MMENKTQYEALMEELQKIAENFTDAITELGDILAKILPDIEIPEEEEDTWEMKCPYENGDTHYCLQPNGHVFADCWEGIESDNRYFSQGNIFPTEQAAELESKRRNLLTRFRAFKNECNGDWKPNWKNSYENKYFICEIDSNLEVYVSSIGNSFAMFGYFKNSEDGKRAIELFGDEIKALFVDCEASK